MTKLLEHFHLVLEFLESGAFAVLESLAGKPEARFTMDHFVNRTETASTEQLETA